DPERREAPSGKRLIPDGVVDPLDEIAMDPDGLGDRLRSHHGTSMHDLQSVLPWNSCESFAWFAGTASPHSAQRLKPSGGVVFGAGSFGAVVGGLMHCATAAAACSSAEGGVAGTVSCFAVCI